MSKYTTEIRFICETFSGLSESEGYDKIGDIIENSRDKIFDFDYPIFDEEYRPVLEHKILRHFYTREIGQETVGLFKLKLDTMMNDIMPYYNQLYESTLLEFNPLTDIAYSRSGSESLSQSESTSTSYSESNSSSLSMSQSESETGSDNERNSMMPESHQWTLEQDTPQNGLTDVENMNYLTKATKVQNGGTDYEYINRGHSATENMTSATVGNSIGANTNVSRRQAFDTKGYLESIMGYRNNNPSKLLKDYRDTFLNIDLMIIGELEPLFFQLW